MEIHDAEMFDVPEIAQLYETMRRRLAKRYLPEELNIPIPYSFWEEYFAEVISSGTRQIAIAYDWFGGVVGMVDAGSPINSKRDDWDNTERYFPFCDYQLHSLVVHPDHRRQGTGTALMNYAAGKFALRMPTMVYWAHEADKEAQNFCLGLDAGFAGVREVSIYGHTYLENAYIWHLPSAAGRTEEAAKVFLRS